jgi:hypothetical protein
MTRRQITTTATAWMCARCLGFPIAAALTHISSAAMAADDPGSLDNLHDIITPAPVPFWAPAPGWYGVAVLLAAAVIYALRRCWRTWRRNGYRRAALMELDAIERRWRAAPSVGNPVAEMQVLLKRCALAAYPRDTVAGLSGPAWSTFLDARLNSSTFTDCFGELLAKGSYQLSPVSPADVDALLQACRRWIKGHRPWQQPMDGQVAPPLPKVG